MNNSRIPPPPPKRKKIFALPINQIVCGDNLTVVSDWPDNCIDAIVTDPPYGLEFMGKEWDKLNKHVKPRANSKYPKSRNYDGIKIGSDSNNYQAMQQWHYQWAKAMLRICKPGAFLLCFGGTRTFHRLTCAIEDAGWEIRDCLLWLYGSGFPKSHDISKAIDKKMGKERKKLAPKPYTSDKSIQGNSYGKGGYERIQGYYTAPATLLAQLWDGYGTALKPAWEPIIVAMKPLDGTFANNAEKWKVAGLNIDGGRISYQGKIPNMGGRKIPNMGGEGYGFKIEGRSDKLNIQGRWPANLILDEKVGKMLDEQQPNASRFFYCAKTSRKERNLGLGDLSGKKVNDGRQTPIDNPYQRGETIRKNTHPTVKPLTLMKCLCTLLKMPNQDQIILDPFVGSGTTAMACKALGINYIGIEKESEYCEIAKKRIAAIKPCVESK